MIININMIIKLSYGLQKWNLIKMILWRKGKWNFKLFRCIIRSWRRGIRRKSLCLVVGYLILINKFNLRNLCLGVRRKYLICWRYFQGIRLLLTIKNLLKELLNKNNSGRKYKNINNYIEEAIVQNLRLSNKYNAKTKQKQRKNQETNTTSHHQALIPAEYISL